LEQDFSDFEIIISDNNSTDNSWKIIEDYALKDNRIIVHQSKVNIGFSGNLDLVSSQASGEYQILVSSDDLMNKGALNFYERFVEQCGSDKIIFSSSCLRIDSEGLQIGIDGPKSMLWFNSDIDDNLSTYFDCNIYKVPSKEMFRR
jgi:glycosyltransferase involved in cell wall biosynthesis